MRTGTVFRLSADDSRPVRSSQELQELQRRRLRLISGIVASATGVLAIIATVVRRQTIAADTSTLFTEPPLPGALLLLAMVAGALVWMLAPGRVSSLRQLRIIESAGIALTALFFLINQALALRQMVPAFLGKPMEMGVAQGAPWGILFLAYGVLVPSSLRRAAWRAGAVACAAFLPDLITLPSREPLAFALGSYLALKILVMR